MEFPNPKASLFIVVIGIIMSLVSFKISRDYINLFFVLIFIQSFLLILFMTRNYDLNLLFVLFLPLLACGALLSIYIYLKNYIFFFFVLSFCSNPSFGGIMCFLPFL